MTAPHGHSADRFRIWQPVMAVTQHTAPCTRNDQKNFPIRSYPGDIGEISYFWSDGRFCVTWRRHPNTPVFYAASAWPGTVGPAPTVTDTLPPPAPDTRGAAWDDAIDDYFQSHPIP